VRGDDRSEAQREKDKITITRHTEQYTPAKRLGASERQGHSDVPTHRGTPAQRYTDRHAERVRTRERM
jgi:hypothetical protein